jgi:hypothetical protein
MLRLDEKLKRIRAGQYRPSDFIIADAKDTDMGSGVTGTGFDRSNPAAPRPRSRREFLDQIKLVVRQNVVDIMLVSPSNLELLQEEGVFAGSQVKPAIRANDTTDCWASVRHGVYAGRPSRPFRTASLSRVVTGTATPAPGAPVTGTDLGLYSVTFLNDRDADAAALEAFANFRAEAAANNFKYFYEAFNPNVDCGLSREATGEFLNDCILRSLAGVMKADRPQFLKIPFNGPRALEELAAFDSDLVVGVLGGGGGTVRDTFELVAQAERYGGRVALFGRKINQADAPLELIRLLRAVAEREIPPRQAVRAYHAALGEAKIVPVRSFDDDARITEEVLLPGAVDKAA